jgi:hypothetical protein
MNPMLQELQRWQKQNKRGRHANRWTRWAEFFLQRFGLLQSFGPSAGFTFVHPLTPRVPPGQRAIKQTWTFAPRINLSISPILREVIWRNAQCIPWPTEHAPSAMIFKQALPANENAWHPVSRILQRTMRVDQYLQTMQRHLFVHDKQEVIRRLSSEKQRLEIVAYESVTRQLRKPSAVVAFEQGMSETTKQKTAPIPAGGFAQNRAMPEMPGINLNDLTDRVLRQIDQKVIAHRERMGKVF